MYGITKVVLALAMILGMASAFVQPSAIACRPVSHARPSRSAMSMSTYWEGKSPPSSVLGPVLEKMPSALLGMASLAALGVGTYSVHESNIFHNLSADSVNPQYVIGSLLTPISWGLHVASWIQKQNSK